MEKVLNASRYLVLVAVLVCIVASILLYILSVFSMGRLIMAAVLNLPTDTDTGKIIAVTLLTVLDTLLIAMTFQIIGVGFYRLFVTQTEKLPDAVEAKDFDLLKASILRLGIVILTILFIEQAVDEGATLNTLYFGTAIALIIIASSWAAERMTAHHR